jgi:hypothetical protein
MLARRWRRIPCENFVKHLGVCHVASRLEEDMVTGGAQGSQEEGGAAPSQPCRGAAPNQPCGGAMLVPVGGGSVDDASLGTPRWRTRVWQEEARGRRIYGATAKSSGSNGKIKQWRQIVRRRSGWGERARARAWVNVPTVGPSRACQLMPRAATDASDLTPRIGQNTRRTNFFYSRCE